jgi:hypothetical protein
VSGHFLAELPYREHLERYGEEHITMGERGSKDKAGKEERKKPKLTIKEKRKLKNEKKNPNPLGSNPS